MSLTKDTYAKTAVPALKEAFGYANSHEVPRLEKVTINIGTGRALNDKKLMETMVETLRRITGQEPLRRAARKSISNFAIREGQTVGLQATLRGPRMESFLDRLIHVTLPRVRDFRGLPAKSFDGNGNYTFGLPEHNVFPEIKVDEVENLHGIQITITTSAKTNEEGRTLLTSIGFPFERPDQS